MAKIKLTKSAVYSAQPEAQKPNSSTCGVPQEPSFRCKVFYAFASSRSFI